MDLVVGDDGRPRCWWGTSTPDYVAYHDTEWGFGVTDDHRLFEKLCLEGFQVGTVVADDPSQARELPSRLRRFRSGAVAAFGEHDVDRLLADAGIIRHQGKIRSTINNANRAIEMIAEFGSLASYVWPHATFGEAPTEIPALTAESTAISKDLKRRGWTFVGPTTVYAFMQAMGLVNDHLDGCWVRDDAERRRRAAHATVTA